MESSDRKTTLGRHVGSGTDRGVRRSSVSLPLMNWGVVVRVPHGSRDWLPPIVRGEDDPRGDVPRRRRVGADG